MILSCAFYSQNWNGTWQLELTYLNNVSPNIYWASSDYYCNYYCSKCIRSSCQFHFQFWLCGLPCYLIYMHGCLVHHCTIYTVSLESRFTDMMLSSFLFTAFVRLFVWDSYFMMLTSICPLFVHFFIPQWSSTGLRRVLVIYHRHQRHLSCVPQKHVIPVVVMKKQD